MKNFTTYPKSLLATIILFIGLSVYSSSIAQDTIPPQAICKNAVLELDNNGQASLTAAMIDNGSYDENGAVTFELSQTEFGCDHVGANTVSLIVRDAAGNASTCTATVNVENTDINLLVQEGFEILIKSNVVFENDFENPFHTNFKNCAPDFAQNLVKELYGDIFDQQWTVETMQINGPAGQYHDPQGVGGDYCLGMLGRIQDDKIAFTFDRKDLDFVNLRMDVSAIDVPKCGGPFGVNVPKFNFKLYNTPSGVWNFNKPGTLLDEKNAQGTVPGPTPYTFNWQEIQVGFDASGATNGFVTMVIDQIFSSGYAALDNFLISSSTDTAKYTNQVLVTEGQTAWLRGSFTPGIAKNATIYSSIGTATIDNENGTWYWEYATTDGPNETQDVELTISNACQSESFNFELIVSNVAPELASPIQSSTQEDCNYIAFTGSFFDPGLDTISISATEGTVTWQGQKEGTWVWTSDSLYLPGSHSVLLEAVDEDGDASSLEISFSVGAYNSGLSCSDISLDLDDNGNASLSVENIWQADEPCKIERVWLSKTDFSCSEAAQQSVEIYAEDYTGNIDTCSFLVNLNQQALSLDFETSNYNGYGVTCPGASNGFIAVNTANACGEVTYTWSDGQSDATRTGLSAGEYTVTVIDASGATSSQVINLSAPSTMNLSITGEATVYLGYAPAECSDLVSTVSGGNAPYTYKWSTGSSSASINVCPKNTSTYTLTVTDQNGCSVSASKTVCVIDARAGGGGKGKEKVYVCHNGKVTLSIPDEAVINGHLQHGCRLGRCSDIPCENSSSEGVSALAQNGGDQMAGLDSDEEISNSETESSLTSAVDQSVADKSKEEAIDLNFFSVYPNPSNGKFFVGGNQAYGDVELRIADVSGKTIKSIAVKADPISGVYREELNLNDIKSGLYSVSVRSADSVIGYQQITILK
ncbi:MAG: T9SS type A sorting domain-containing protein [Luteibaculum sp.]